MDPYATEQEQVEALKRWWQKNGMAIIVGVCIGLGSAYAWRGWQASRQAAAEEAAGVYSQLLEYMQDRNLEDAKRNGQDLIERYPKSAYATYAAMALARLAVERKDLSEAAERLRWALEHVPAAEIEPVLRTRLARVLLAADKAGEAWAVINDKKQPGKTPAPSAAVLEVKGDILLAQGKRDEARVAYQEALARNAETGGDDQSPVRVKLDQLDATERP